VLKADVVHGFDEPLVKDIVLINRDSFPSEWEYSDAEEYYKEKLKNADNIHIILSEKDERVGYLLAIPHNEAVQELHADDLLMKEDPFRYYIETVCILPLFRGQKGFSVILKVLSDELKRRGIANLSMHARVSNHFSKIIQKKMKITQIRTVERWKYYNYGESADYIEATL